MNYRSVFLALLLPIAAGGAPERGRELAEVYCGTCHLAPAPDVLDRASWAGSVLPWMATLMGVRNHFKDPSRLQALRESGYVWTSPPLDEATFNVITNYYLSEAPLRLYETNRPPVAFPVTSGFRLRSRQFSPGRNPAATMVKLRRGEFYYGTSQPPRLWRLTSGRRELLHQGAIPSSIAFGEKGFYFADLGSVEPEHRRVANVLFVEERAGRFLPARTIVSDLPRVSDIQIADLNSDGIEDLVVCCFGWIEGEVFWLEGTRDGGFRRHSIFRRSGAVKVVVEGRDLLVLVAQGIESLLELRNDGRGGFAPAIRFSEHAAFGFSDFEARDFDGDGEVEIITANGDFDYEGEGRPDHGIRIYRGSETMEQIFFFQMPGSYQVEVADFDQDGDLDVAGAAFTPGFGEIRTPRTILLENLGDWKFRPWELPHGEDGRFWLIDAEDHDGDGDEDLLLGALYWAPGMYSASNRDVKAAFGTVPVETILLENVFDNGPQETLKRWRHGLAKGGRRSSLFTLPIP